MITPITYETTAPHHDRSIRNPPHFGVKLNTAFVAKSADPLAGFISMSWRWKATTAARVRDPSIPSIGPGSNPSAARPR